VVYPRAAPGFFRGSAEYVHRNLHFGRLRLFLLIALVYSEQNNSIKNTLNTTVVGIIIVVVVTGLGSCLLGT
jgi:hypothetical protein